MSTYPNLTLTFLIEYAGRFLLIKRPDDEDNFPGVWAFPGGKVEKGETVVDTILREIKEEAGLEVTREFIPLNSYSFGNSVGMTFLVRAKNANVIPCEFETYRWVSTLDDLKDLPRIAGIDNHLVHAMRESKRGCWLDLEDFRLDKAKYLNV